MCKQRKWILFGVVERMRKLWIFFSVSSIPSLLINALRTSQPTWWCSWQPQTTKPRKFASKGLQRSEKSIGRAGKQYFEDARGYPYLTLIYRFWLTPKAEYRLVRLLSTWSRKTSDWGLGGFLGRRMTLTSCLISSSRSLESEETESCLRPIRLLSSFSAS